MLFSIPDSVFLILLIVAVLGTGVFLSLLTFGDKGLTLTHFVLHVDGRCIFYPETEYAITQASRVGLLGCWLVLTRKQGEHQAHYKTATKHLFIFIDSVSSKDYARLCRTIYRTKTNSQETDEARGLK